MSSKSKGRNSEAGSSTKGATEEVRRAFSALTFEDKLSTLLRIELDMVGDVTDAIVAAAAKGVDEVARAFSCTDASDSKGPSHQQTSTT